MEDNKKRSSTHFPTLMGEPDPAGKKPRTPANDDEEEEAYEDVLSWLCTDDEEPITDLSPLLDAAETHAPPFKVTFSGDPYSSSLVFQSSSAYVTINGNDESCGSSFSESESSVMASVDMGGWLNKPTWDQLLFPPADGGAWGYAAHTTEARVNEEANGVACLGEGSGGSSEWVDGYDYDDLLAKFLGEDFMESE